jgi:DNA-binding MurR/RpiR family transcriptional regulator
MPSLSARNCHPTVSDLKQLIASRSIIYPLSAQGAMRLLLSDPKIVAFGTLHTAAHACGVSATTMSRLASHSGYSNFKEMQAAFRQHVILLAQPHGRVVKQ